MINYGLLAFSERPKAKSQELKAKSRSTISRLFFRQIHFRVLMLE